MSETRPTAQHGAPETVEPPADDEAGYGTLVEEAFIAERGTPFLLSAKDWTLIQSWRERGIPVGTVIRAVRETFERRRARASVGKISSLAYCANAVDERWEMERRGLVGKADPTVPAPEPEPVATRLARAVASLTEAEGRCPGAVPDEAWRAALGKAREKAQAVPADAGFDAAEEALGAAEKALAKVLAKCLSEPARAELDRRVAESLGDVSHLPSEVRSRVRKAVEARELRGLLGLPPLTLFDV